jgi:hypothetical protein
MKFLVRTDLKKKEKSYFKFCSTEVVFNNKETVNFKIKFSFKK